VAHRKHCLRLGRVAVRLGSAWPCLTGSTQCHFAATPPECGRGSPLGFNDSWFYAPEFMQRLRAARECIAPPTLAQGHHSTSGGIAAIAIFGSISVRRSLTALQSGTAAVTLSSKS
jgi:hypothetical protein